MAGPDFGAAGEQGNTVATINQGNGYDIVTNTGAVYAENGATYYGGTNTGIGGAVGENIVNAIALPGGGYQLINAQGQTYNFGPGVGQYNNGIINQPQTPPAAPPPPATSPNNAQGFATLQAYFQQLGISDPTALQWAQNQITSGASTAQVEVTMYQQPWFQNRFPEIALAQKNGLPPISPQDVLNYEQTVSQLEQQVGLPQGFISKNEITQLMGKYNVSATELTDRLTQGYQASLAAVQNVPQVANALKSYYGVGQGGLAAYWLDPTKALAVLQNQFTAAQIGGAASLAGFGGAGGISQQQAQELAGFGVTPTQASSGFQQLGHMAQAYNPTIGNPNAGLTTQQQIAGQFLGNAQDQLAMQLAASTRQASFEGGSSYTGTTQGSQGLGAAVPTR